MHRSPSVIHDTISRAVAGKIKGAIHDDKPAVVGGYAPQTQPAVMWVYDHIDSQIDKSAGLAVSAVLDAVCSMTAAELDGLLTFHRISHGVIHPGGDAGLNWIGSNPPTGE